ncbi:hypothetical protein [Blastomonas fulva]|uniref:Right handed beta helix domain-containing protein n=1 Tax=Blastomonas fulva TaxID=1550728 RepID=A0ABM6M5E0_9SPHN|nr:hypothetical protein [Blastomonas fulva]ASR51034.1 hypothetical protein B5J99_05760 [Blastomonas fulva]
MDGSEQVVLVKNGVTRRGAVGALVAASVAPHVDAAELAAATALAASNFYGTATYGTMAAAIAAGEAATAPGGLFSVNDANGNLLYRERTAGGSVEVARTLTPVSLSGEAGAEQIGTADGRLDEVLARLKVFNRGTAHSVDVDLRAKLGEQVSVSDWGVVPSPVYIPGTGAKINRALEEAPLGSTLRFTGFYYTEVPIVQRRGVHIHFDPGAAVIGIFDDPGLDVWTVAIEKMPFAQGDVRRLRFDNMNVEVAFSYAARHALTIKNAAPLIGNLQCVVNNGYFGAQDDSTGYGINIEGLVTHLHTFSSCHTNNGIFLNGCADGNRFLNGLMTGTKPGVVANLAGGAFKTAIKNNIIVARDGAMIVLGGSQIDFHSNQIEQVEALGPNQNEHSASVIISTQSYGSRGVSIKGNNFGGAKRVDYHIYAKSAPGKKVEDLLLGAGNTFSRAQIKDIKIADAGVRYTTIGSGQLLRGERGTGGHVIYPDLYDANTDDVNGLLDVEDNGTGTRGVRLRADRLGGASPTVLQNGWTCPATFYVRKDEHDRVTFNGYAVAPGAAAEIQIARLPDGFRPSEVTFFNVHGATGVIQPNGAMVATTTAAGNVGLSGVSFDAKRSGYDPSY